MIIGIEAMHANKPNRTGVEWYSYFVIQELKKIIPQEVRVILYTKKALVGDLGILPTNWEQKILHWPLKKLWSQTRLACELWRHPPDVFFAPAQLVPWYSPKNTATTIHDSAFMADKKSYWWASRWYLQFMNKLIIKKSKKIILTAKFNLEELKKYYGVEVEKKCAVIPLAYDNNLFQKISNIQYSILDKYKIKQPYIISVSRLEEKKNTARLVQAFNLVKKDFPKLKLLLVGTPGVGFENIQQAIVDSPFKSDIILPGYIENSDLPKILSFAEVFVFPSLYEGFGIPVLEAMACGVPVVAANNTALPEVGGKAAVYVDPLKIEEIVGGILKILTDTNFRNSQINSGLEQVKQFSWSKTAQLTWEEIKKDLA